MLDPNLLFERQLNQWPACKERYQQLSLAKRQTMQLRGCEFVVSYNPSRAKSAKADIRNGIVSEKRSCFLCKDSLPAEQLRVEVEAIPSHNHYIVAVNPFPIVDHHFTIICSEHVRQDLNGRLWDMAFFADLMPDYLIFFNGACSGASAPDHMHFQAVPKTSVPMTGWTIEKKMELGVTQKMPRLANSDYKNVLTWTDGNEAYWLVINRKSHRPSQYFLPDDDPNKVIISPASLEFCGLVPLCREEDYEKMTPALLEDLLHQCASREPMLRVGIMEGPQIRFSAEERVHSMNYVMDDCMKDVMDYSSNRAEMIEMNEYWCHQEPFTLENVTIGKQFHWQQQEDQVFKGSLHIIAKEGQLHAINVIPVEEYLKSVISSEMSATNCLELLKAHAIISRSWVLRQIDGSRYKATDDKQLTQTPSLQRLVKIWDHTDHHLYDVCADDHCQRYQGITRQLSPLVETAINETRGIVLQDSEGKICDARFSKCCGGKTELFSTCWQDTDFDYLASVDDPYCSPEFIDKLPGGMNAVLQQVLNNYDQKTIDFHDWEVRYTQHQLSELIESKLHLGLGKILRLDAIERGASGRIKMLKIVGEEKTVEIGKELLIRKALSDSHLYSSWFDVENPETAGTDEFVIHGHGWGHGVGLCQIGAAAMALSGFTAEKILEHYYPGATLTHLYN